MRMIAQRVLSGVYPSLADMEKDFHLMARNGKTFNEPRSAVYQAAVSLSRILKGKRSEAEHPPQRSNKDRKRSIILGQYNIL
ncbi:unnamed protein product [Protopolystoma xenopodis]|uniref:Bromo domain-containing protein n=1 Tax=Protopolystoma xenopodis TaxID=117903 RepID=A0A3S5BKV0_9PLAT|nr:unnamed protein product [Protopolystoma xenopodis]